MMLCTGVHKPGKKGLEPPWPMPGTYSFGQLNPVSPHHLKVFLSKGTPENTDSEGTFDEKKLLRNNWCC